jgi:hypothetical protein
MSQEEDRKQLMRAIDEETRRWLRDFPAWKRRKAAKPEDVTIRFLLGYMSERCYDYYFIQRNYSQLVPLLESYAAQYGETEGLTRLIADAGSSLEAG